MRLVGLGLAWLVSLALLGLSAMWWRDYVHGASIGFDVEPTLPEPDRGYGMLVARLWWAPASAALVLGALLNPLLLKRVPGLGTYWVRALAGFAIAAALLGYAGYVGLHTPV